MIFNSEMVKAILDGRKTQTRRMVKPQPPEGSRLWGMPKVWDDKRNLIFWREGDRSNYGKPLLIEVGDIIWVRETFALTQFKKPVYKADNRDANGNIWSSIACDPDGVKWTPSIHMPRWASRITLEVTAVRVERLQDISEEDARKEGVEWESHRIGFESGTLEPYEDAVDGFERLWNRIYSNWDANPWAWVYEFRRVK